MEALNETKISDIGKCSGVLWKTFKELCTAAESISEREKVIDMAFVIFRDKVMEYRNTDLYSYAVEYSHALIAEIERLLYPGKIKKSNYQDIKRMGYGDFVEYIKEPNPGDLITVLNEDGENMARIKVRTVVKL